MVLVIAVKAVLVPFSGFLSFYYYQSHIQNRNTRSRPLFGVSIFLHIVEKLKDAIPSSRPLFGVSIFLPEGDIEEIKEDEFSSPFRGFYLSTMTDLIKLIIRNVLVPFSGFLSFY